MKEIYKTWTYEDFIAFALYYAAMSDFIFTDEEKELVLKHTNDDSFKEISHFYKNNSDYENAQVIIYFKDNFLKTDEDKLNLKAAVKEMFDSDGEYNILEKTANRAFDLLLR